MNALQTQNTNVMDFKADLFCFYIQYIVRTDLMTRFLFLTHTSFPPIFKIEIYASSASWINNLSIDVWFVMIGQY